MPACECVCDCVCECACVLMALMMQEVQNTCMHACECVCDCVCVLMALMMQEVENTRLCACDCVCACVSVDGAGGAWDGEGGTVPLCYLCTVQRRRAGSALTEAKLSTMHSVHSTKQEVAR